MNFRIFFLVVFIGFSVGAQNNLVSFSEKIKALKVEDNLEEFVYVHLDEFAKKPTIENLQLFKNLEKSIWRKPKNTKEALSFIYFHVNYGYYLKEFGQIDNAIIAYEKGYAVYKDFKIKQYDIIEFCLKPLANCYTRIGEINRAEDILKVTIEKAKDENSIDQVVAAYINLAAVCRTKGAVSTAISYLNLGLAMNKNRQVKATLFSELAINYVELESYEKALSFIKLSNKENVLNEKSISFRNAVSLGLVQLKLGKLEEAESNLNLAVETATTIYGKNHREVCKIVVHLANVFHQKKDFKKALSTYQKALSLLIPSFKSKQLTDNPASVNFYPENTLKDVFDGKATVFSEMRDFENALQNYDVAFKVEDELRLTYLDQNSKVLHQQENRRRSEKCIETCYQLFVETRNNMWIEKGFLYAEKTKNIVVAEAKEKIIKSSKITGSNLFQQEKELLFKKAQLTKSIIVEQLKESNADIRLLANLNNERDAIGTELQLLNEQISTQYPLFKSAFEITISKEIIETALLKNAACFIEFFDGSNYLYKFSVEKEKPITLTRIEKSPLFKQHIETFVNYFSDERGTAIQNNIKEYTALGFQLYTQLFGNAPSGKLIVVPDGMLNFIPFDALITEKTSSSNFENLPYLIHRNQITLTYSGSILLQKSTQKKTKKEVLGFFPIFENNYRGLSELSYTAKEATTIKQNFNGMYLLKKDATKKRFESEVGNYSIIHLSTHASAGSYYEPPAIEFYDETLYLPEIYGYNLQTDLLVLSACETGIGTISKGEGAMSLAYGFAYAGVQNLIVSLWKVNDKSTELLMNGFYSNFAETGNKSNSLAQSKLDYLLNEDISAAKKSPYYWASFVYIGNMDSNEASKFSMWWLLVIGIIVGITYFLIKKR